MPRMLRLPFFAALSALLTCAASGLFHPSVSSVSAGVFHHSGANNTSIQFEPAVMFKYSEGRNTWLLGVSGFYGGVAPAVYDSGGAHYISGFYKQWAIYEDSPGRFKDIRITHFRVCPFAGAAWNMSELGGRKQYLEFTAGLPFEGEVFRFRDTSEDADREFSVFKAVSIISPYAGIASELFDAGDATVRLYAGWSGSFLGIGGALISSSLRAGIEAEFRQYRYDPVSVPQEEPKEEGGMIWSEDGKEEVIEKK